MQEDLDALERLERTGKALAARPCTAGEGRHPTAPADEQMHDEVAFPVVMRPEDEGLQPFGAGIHETRLRDWRAPRERPQDGPSSLRSR